MDCLVREFGAEKIILLGLRARGEETPDSDTDLVVIKRTQKPLWDRLAEVTRRICRWQRAFEVLVYTPAEFAALQRESACIREEVSAKGKVLHGAGAAWSGGRCLRALDQHYLPSRILME